MAELLNCPFCGGNDLHVETYDVQPDNYHSGYVRCGECDCQGKTPDTWLANKDEAESAAIASWNTRAALQPASGEAFKSDGKEEERWIEHVSNACPHCNGSGHKDDVQPAPDEKPVDLEWRSGILYFNGRQIGWVQCWSSEPDQWQVHFMGDFHKLNTRDEARTALEKAAREWLAPITQPQPQSDVVKALVEAAVPLEAMLLCGQKTLGMGDDMWAGIVNAVDHIRKALRTAGGARE